MKYCIENSILLKKILWTDTTLDSITGIIGLFFTDTITRLLGLPFMLIKVVCIITLIYAVVAFILANQKLISIPLLRVLVYANWGWTIVSVILLLFHCTQATIFGIIFLILQIIAVGLLAYMEGKQIVKK